MSYSPLGAGNLRSKPTTNRRKGKRRSVRHGVDSYDYGWQYNIKSLDETHYVKQVAR